MILDWWNIAMGPKHMHCHSLSRDAEQRDKPGTITLT